MIVPHPVVAAGTTRAALSRNREVRARLKAHLDAEPEILTALLIHLDLARDDYRRRSRRAAFLQRAATLRRADRAPECGPDDSSPAA